MSVKVYVEGGGGRENKDASKRCNEGFASYCQKLAPAKRQPKFVACGGRQETFDRFSTAVRNGQTGEVFVLLVDAEGPVNSEAPVTSATAAEHLHNRDGWDFPAINHHKVFLMVQAMESWFLADREALANFYDGGFLANSLPGSPKNVEAVLKDDLEPKLKHASEPTKTKGEYHKVKPPNLSLGLGQLAVDTARILPLIRM